MMVRVVRVELFLDFNVKMLVRVVVRVGTC